MRRPVNREDFENELEPDFYSYEIGRRLTELRTSSAAGPHGKLRKDRWNLRRRAIQQDVRDSS